MKKKPPGGLNLGSLSYQFMKPKFELALLLCVLCLLSQGRSYAFLESDVVHDHLVATRIKGSDNAQAIRMSLPLPRELAADFAFSGIPSQIEPVAFWSENGTPGRPRRVIMGSVVDSALENIALSHEALVEGTFHGPEIEIKILDEKKAEVALPYEINELVFRMDERELGVRIGLLTDDGINWWQWLQSETLSSGPVYKTIRVAGAIPVVFEEDIRIDPDDSRFDYPWLHRHNHVRGELIARVYANGVMELTLRHLNAFFFTEGADVEGVVPVFGFRALGMEDFDGEREVTGPEQWDWDGVQIDTTDASGLLGEAFPGRVWMDGEVLVYQPYSGVEAFAGSAARNRTGDAYLSRAEDRKFPKGMARSVRMTASLGDAPPEVAVYLAPPWWYGLCEDFAGKPLLPIRDETEGALEIAVDWFNENCYKNRFDDGGLPRGWEGEAPYAHLLAAWYFQDAQTYDLALRTCYHLTDVAVDHAFTSVRMHGYEAGAQSLPMQRFMAPYGAYLETADPYLKETAIALADRAYSWDVINYPRRSYGRDAAYIRSMVFMYRYTGEGFYLRRAREAIGRVMAVQLEDGSFTDQGGTTGIHSTPNLIVKPWMGLIATEALVDYLTVVEDAEVADAVLRFADWLLGAKITTDEGTHWTYQMSWAGGTRYLRIHGERDLPTDTVWHVEYLAKVLGWASLYTDDCSYYASWYDSFTNYAHDRIDWDHGANKTIQNLIWQRAVLWNARLVDNKILLSPKTCITETSPGGRVLSPLGAIEVSPEAQTISLHTP